MMKLRANWSLLILITSLVSPSFTYFQHSYAVYVYGFAELPTTESLLGYFSRSDCEVVFRRLNESSSNEFLTIVETLRVLGIEVIPSDVCMGCTLLHQTWNDTLMGYASPLVGFFCDGRLTSITVGITESQILDQAFAVGGDDLKVFAFDKEYSLHGEDVRSKLEKLFLGESKTSMNALNLISSISLLALADSMNPCTFAVFTALLLLTLHALGKAKTTLTGLSFILAVFICYYVLGLGFIRILATIPHVAEVVAIIGLAVGVFSIARGLKPKFESPVPKSLRKFIEAQISKSYISPIASFVLGAIASFTLLPCSSGPYIVSVGLLSALNDPFQVHFLLTLYNAIFVIPLIAILLTVLFSGAYIRKIKAFRGTKLGVMELISGLLLVIVCVYLLLS